MIYQRDNKRYKQKRLRSILIPGFLLVLIIVLNFFTPHLFSPLVHALEVPASVTRGGIGGYIGSLWGTFTSKRNLVIQNRLLREQVALLTAQRLERDALQIENTTLKNLLGKATTTEQEVVARILSKPGFSPYDTIIIDAGIQEGVKVGDLVLADRSVILGEVEQVYGTTATVILYSSSDRKTNVLIGEHALETEAVGKGGGNFEVELPRNTDIKVDDLVHLAAFPDKLFGAITIINISDADSFERILFRSAVDINHISHVTVYRR
jgi:cell shape-determining protein MreC